MSDYTNDFASMAIVQECAAGIYVSIAMRILDVQPRRSLSQNEAVTAHGRCHGGGALWVHYVFACAVGILGPLLASLDLGVTCVVRALKFANAPSCKSQEGAWIRADVPTFLPRVAAARLGCRSRMPSRLSQHE